MILLTRKSGKVRWKLTEVEERVFGGEFRGGSMQKQRCENEGAPTVSWRVQHTLY